jgi:hypothetical protein
MQQHPNKNELWAKPTAPYIYIHIHKESESTKFLLSLNFCWNQKILVTKSHAKITHDPLATPKCDPKNLNAP